LAVESQRLLPERARPAEFGNVASEMKPADTRVPVASTYDTSPFWPIATLVASGSIRSSVSAPPAVRPWT
jgi:hypothetical protein